MFYSSGMQITEIASMNSRLSAIEEGIAENKVLMNVGKKHLERLHQFKFKMSRDVTYLQK